MNIKQAAKNKANEMVANKKALAFGRVEKAALWVDVNKFRVLAGLAFLSAAWGSMAALALCAALAIALLAYEAYLDYNLSSAQIDKALDNTRYKLERVEQLKAQARILMKMPERAKEN